MIKIALCYHLQITKRSIVHKGRDIFGMEGAEPVFLHSQKMGLLTCNYRVK